MPRKFLIPSLLAVSFAADAALAHTGAGTVFGFSSGFQHPLGGLDHLLAMFAVGLLAAQPGGRAIWRVPGAFVGMMIVGALVGLAGFELSGVELGIVVSIVAIALPVAFALGMPAAPAMAYVGFFALFHGHAHGAELPVDAEAAPYIAGFALATAIIHAAGVVAGLGIGRVDALRRSHGLRIAGALVAIAGLGLAVG
ncbi:MAG: HupE/UreJ family protein [Xanthobacteraceae bacterium]